MRIARLVLLVGIAGILMGVAQPARAQGKGKAKGEPGFAVTVDKAIAVTREVLGTHGFEVFRVEERDGVRIVHYRAGNRGKGKGKGPPRTLIIKLQDERVVFEETPPEFLVDIEVKLEISIP